MNRRSFLALAASPLLAPLLAACKSPLPAKGYEVMPCGPPPPPKPVVYSTYLNETSWWTPFKETSPADLNRRMLREAVADHKRRWTERNNEAPLTPEKYPEMRELLGPDLTLDDNGVIVLKETPDEAR